MAHKKAGGSTNNGRDSESKRLGVKKFGGEKVKAGAILIRQRGTRYLPDDNVGCGRDHTLYAKIAGQVKFNKRKRPSRKGSRWRVYVSVLAVADDDVQGCRD